MHPCSPSPLARDGSAGATAPLRCSGRGSVLLGWAILWFSLRVVLAGDPVAFRSSGPGVAEAHVVRDEPWSIHVVRIERDQPQLRFMPSLAFHDRIGLNPLSDQVSLFPKSLGTPVAAINGDFYAIENDPMPGDPRGLFIQNGHLISAPIERDCLWFEESGTPHIDTIRPRFTVRVGSSQPVALGLNEDFDGSRPVLLTEAASKAIEWDAPSGWVLASCEECALARQANEQMRRMLATIWSRSRRLHWRIWRPWRRGCVEALPRGRCAACSWPWSLRR